METFLQRITERKTEELGEAKRQRPVAALKERALFHEPRRSLVQALRPAADGSSSPTRIIAEIKRASPSRGMLRADLDPVALACRYRRGGAAAISVLTERHFFLGRLESLEEIRRVCALPLLRKDFLSDPYQIYEARAYGADAALLIAAMLADHQLADLLDICRELRIEPLVEVHARAELERVLPMDAPLIGINNRDLHTFRTDLRTTRELAREVPAGRIVISESGIRGRADIVLLEEAGVHAFLIGESLVQAEHPEAKLRELLGG